MDYTRKGRTPIVAFVRKLGNLPRTFLYGSTVTSYLAMAFISGFLLLDAATMAPNSFRQVMHAQESEAVVQGQYILALVRK